MPFLHLPQTKTPFIPAFAGMKGLSCLKLVPISTKSYKSNDLLIPGGFRPSSGPTGESMFCQRRQNRRHLAARF